MLSLGTYPDVTLAKVRARRDEARKLLTDSIDPRGARKAKEAARQDSVANRFEIIARDWFEKFKPMWVDSHSDKIIRRLERDMFPWLVSRPIAEITVQEHVAALRHAESRGAVETARRAQQNCGQIGVNGKPPIIGTRG